jgi:hypothetical protein
LPPRHGRKSTTDPTARARPLTMRDRIGLKGSPRDRLNSGERMHGGAHFSHRPPFGLSAFPYSQRRVASSGNPGRLLSPTPAKAELALSVLQRGRSGLRVRQSKPRHCRSTRIFHRCHALKTVVQYCYCCCFGRAAACGAARLTVHRLCSPELKPEYLSIVAIDFSTRVHNGRVISVRK